MGGKYAKQGYLKPQHLAKTASGADGAHRRARFGHANTAIVLKQMRPTGRLAKRVSCLWSRVLIDAGYQDLADKVVHVAVVEGDGAGYDVRSYHTDGSEKYIEVKTTQGPKETDFFLSANELRFSEAQPKAFYLYRVFNYHPEVNGGQFYVINGPLSELFELRATNYRVSNLIGDVSVTDFGG